MEQINQQITRELQKSAPTWTEIFQNIGVQLHKRSGLLTKRVLKASALGLVAFFVIDLFVRLMNVGHFEKFFIGEFIETFISIYIYGTIALIIVIIITIILMTIVEIEQFIWLDSYFDGKNLTPQESWKIAKKLYWGWSYFQFEIFCRYYLWIILAAIIFVPSWFYIFGLSGFTNSQFLIAIFSPVFFIGGSIGLILWQRYMKVKLSFAPFLFLDRYKRGTILFSQFWHDFFRELKELNEINKDGSFKKNVLLEIGADIAVTIEQYIIGQIHQGFSIATEILPPVPRTVLGTVGDTTAAAAREVAYRVIMFGKLAGRQVLYNFAFKTLHGQKREVNEYIYSLKD
jgi:hypothetical protein